MSQVKTYVLLEHTKPTIAAYQRVNKDQRVRLDKRPIDHAYLKQTFTTKDGRSRTARLKLNCNTIWQDEQIKPEIGIPANEPFTQEERDAVKFTNEVLMTNHPMVQQYLEAIPQFDNWWKPDSDGRTGISTEQPLYTLLNKEVEGKEKNADFRKRLRAANKVASIMDLKEGQDLMIRLNGSFFTPPNDIIEIQNALIEFVDDADDAMLDALLKDDMTVDEAATILIGRSINAGIISFDAIPNQVAKKINGQWVAVKMISDEYTTDERKRYFAEFLTNENGKLLLEDLKKAINGNVNKNEVAEETEEETDAETSPLKKKSGRPKKLVN